MEPIINSTEKRLLYTLGIATDVGLMTKGADLAPILLFRHFELNNRLTEIFNLKHTCNKKHIDGIIKEDIQSDILPIHPFSKKELHERLLSVQKLCQDIAQTIETDLNYYNETKKENIKSLFIGGDHSIAMGTYAGVSNHYHSSSSRTNDEELGVLWIDAHSDFHVRETSTSQNIHGMALAAILGKGYENRHMDRELFACCPTKFKPSTENIIILGARDLDEPEIVRLEKLKIKVFTASDIEKFTLQGILERIKETFDKNGVKKLHVSLDLDSIDPIFAPGVSTPVSSGLTDREIIYIGDFLNVEKLIYSLDVVEYNITNDVQSKTAILASRIVLHFLGKSYYRGLSR